MKIPLLLLVIVLFSSLASADVICQQTSYEFNYNYDNTPQTQDLVGTSCRNNGTELVTLSTSFPFGNPSFFTLDSASTSIGAGSTKGTLKIQLDTSLTVGSYFGFILLGDQEPIEIIVNVEGEVIDPTACQIRPSITDYNQNYQQGAQVTETITFDPQNCDGDIVISGVSIQGGVVDSNGKRKPVSKGMITSDEINVNIDTEGLPSKTYDGIKLTFNAYGIRHTIRFKIGVTGSAGGSGDFDVNNLPKCSLTNNIININDTHSLVCTNLVQDVEIRPRVDSEYVRGINKEVEANQFSWIFQGKKFGNTMLYADFYYLGVPVGDSFFQELKIQSASGQTPGTSLILSFSPSLSIAKSGEIVLIQLLDNKTQSLVEDPEIYIESEPITNMTGKSFRYAFETGINYSIRAIAPGYNDLTSSVKLTSKPIIITISPSSGNTKTQFNITTDVNATVFIDGLDKGSAYFGTLSSGTHIVESYKEGYIDAKTNLTVDSTVIISGDGGEFKKGVEQTFTLNKNVSWNVTYQKDADSDIDLLDEGSGNKIIFEPTKKGTYIIQAGDARRVFLLEGRNWHKKWWFMAWYLWIIISGGLIYGVHRYINSSSFSSKVDVGYAGNVRH